MRSRSSSGTPGPLSITCKSSARRQNCRPTVSRRAIRVRKVIDNGPGIPDELRDRIFYPLVSGREGGSGLGLTLAQTFVQQNNGVIEFESRPGLTDFRILLALS